MLEIYELNERTRVLKLCRQVTLCKEDGETYFTGSRKNKAANYFQQSQMICNGSILCWFGRNWQAFDIRTGKRVVKRKFRAMINVAYCQSENRFYYFFIRSQHDDYCSLMRADLVNYKPRVIDEEKSSQIPELPAVLEEPIR